MTFSVLVQIDLRDPISLSLCTMVIVCRAGLLRNCVIARISDPPQRAQSAKVTSVLRPRATVRIRFSGIWPAEHASTCCTMLLVHANANPPVATPADSAEPPAHGHFFLGRFLVTANRPVVERGTSTAAIVSHSLPPLE